MAWAPDWRERQRPEGDEVFLDHCGWFVADLDAAADQLRRLGFDVTIENVHMNRQPDGSAIPSGTINRLATPALGYLEFLGSRGGTPLAAQHRAQLARYEGLHLLAFSSADVPAEASRLAAEGFAPLPPVDMRRAATTRSGETHEARFSVLRVPADAMAEGRMQWCGHHTPDLVWEPGHTDQPNAVDALSGVLWVVADLEEAADRYARFVRKPAAPVAPGVVSIGLERGALLLANADGAAAILPKVDIPCQPFGAAVLMRSRDLEQTARVLTAAGAAFEQAGDRLILPPAEGLGAWIVIHRAGAPPFPG